MAIILTSKRHSVAEIESIVTEDVTAAVQAVVDPTISALSGTVDGLGTSLTALDGTVDGLGTSLTGLTTTVDDLADTHASDMAAVGGCMLASLVKSDADFTTSNTNGVDITGLVDMQITAGVRNFEVVFSGKTNNTTTNGWSQVRLLLDSGSGYVAVAHSAFFKHIGGSADETNVYLRFIVVNPVEDRVYKVKAQLIAPFGTGVATLVVVGSMLNPAILSAREV